MAANTRFGITQFSSAGEPASNDTMGGVVCR
jgi:hypothetical protein